MGMLSIFGTVAKHQIFIFDDVTSQTVKDVRDQITVIGNKDFELHINSRGGNVMDGIAIFNILKQIPNRIEAFIDGLSGSIAAVIPMAADSISMSATASLFVHNVSNIIQGDSDEFEKQGEILGKLDNTIASIFSDKTRLSIKMIKNFMDEETTFTAEEALEFGFIDKIVNPIKAVAYFDKITDKQMKVLESVAQGLQKVKNRLASAGLTTAADDSEKEVIEALDEAAQKRAVAQQDIKFKESKGAETLTAEMVSSVDFIKHVNQQTAINAEILPLLENMNKLLQEADDKLVSTVANELATLLSTINSKTVIPPKSPVHQDLAPEPGDENLTEFRSNVKNINNKGITQ